MKKIVLLMAAAGCMIGCGNKDAQNTQEAERVEVVSTMILDNIFHITHNPSCIIKCYYIPMTFQVLKVV